MTFSRIICICVAVAALVALPVLWYVDPEQAVWMPKCMVHSLTGWQCPGCGITRAAHALLHGEFSRALAYNWFFVISIPYFLSICAVCNIPALRRRERLRRVVTGTRLAWAYVILFFLWFVIRNILEI